ncbi:MAG: cyclic nucleotide-binding domain-containing protein [Deltaproteobacteria bacterium]|nr:cyclic nucleotide-binding domain-containing protein [Deltaproteobacteria bacterium]
MRFILFRYIIEVPEVRMERRRSRIRKGAMSQEDFDFLMNTDLLRATPHEAKSQLIFAMTPIRLRAGERLISQGDDGDHFYLIQRGTCVVSVQRDGETHIISRLKPGELVGEMAILTGEKRTADVHAEVDMVLWGIGRLEFEELCRAHSDLREFLTEIVTRRFSSQKRMAEKTIGRYVINEIIGQGGWSIVYKGAHSSLPMPVAIKMLKHDMAMDPDFMDRFQNEARVIARLSHENLVRVYDIEHLYRTVFIVMEYLEGSSLEDILDSLPRLEFKRTLNLLVQVCRGLRYAHRHGIVHQDIKPANVFVQRRDRAKIVDFGLACPKGCEDVIDFAGTPYYMSPEQIESEPVDERTDIYSLGITAFEMTTGRRPFAYEDVGKVLEAHRSEPLPDPRNINPDLPPGFCAFISKAARKDPSDRYQNMDEALESLLPLAERVGVAVEADSTPRRNMMSLFMFYRKDRQLELSQLVENFNQELKKIGAELRMADFPDL